MVLGFTGSHDGDKVARIAQTEELWRTVPVRYNQSGQPRHFLGQKYAVSECRAPSENPTSPSRDPLLDTISDCPPSQTVSWVRGDFKHTFKLLSVAASATGPLAAELLPVNEMLLTYMCSAMVFPGADPYPPRQIGTLAPLTRWKRRRTDGGVILEGLRTMVQPRRGQVQISKSQSPLKEYNRPSRSAYHAG